MENFIYSKEIDAKWQKKWEETGIYSFNEANIDKKLYLLEMFSYPSGKNLHIGHWWNYGLSDSYGRSKRMQGFELFHPPGFDAFGLPAENYAIKTGVHPEDSTKRNINKMENQFHKMGTTYDWNYEVVTCSPDYYKWTQWLFLKLYEKGLAYRKEAPVNWCPSCMTVLANEQVISGKCERCSSEVTHKSMTQWFFRITAYAEELLEGLEKLDWPDKTKKIQENWIGKSCGYEIDFEAGNDNIRVFTARADDIMGAVCIKLAPEHPLVEKLTVAEYKNAIEGYRESAAKLSEIERTSTVREKTGVFTGAYAVNPVTNKKLPVWVSDHVLMSSGTGAVMAVPEHDEWDLVFAVKYGLPVTAAVGHEEANKPEPYGKKLSQNELPAKPSIKYKLRDWLVSRQRYWGAPIPVIHCDDCGAVPVPEKELPIKLPHNVAFTPNGQSPLASCPEFVNTVCPICGKPAKRETDTLDTFVCSSWYYLRFFDNKNDNEPFSKDKADKIMPVDKYVGGVEHASMHLLYARFITRALRDMGYVSFDEPFSSLVHQGVILGSDGQKMSKRNGAVSPDEYISQYGSDVFRMYLCFGFSFHDGGMWSDKGIKAIARFTARVSRIVEEYLNNRAECGKMPLQIDSGLDYVRNYTIREVTGDIDDFQFNTAVARIMEFANAISAYQTGDNRNTAFEEAVVKDLLLLLAPLAPHFTEELWESIGCEYSIHNHRFPVYDEAKLARDLMQIPVQVDGRLREVIQAPADINDDALKELVIGNHKINDIISGREIRRVIIVKGRLVNIVLK